MLTGDPGPFGDADALMLEAFRALIPPERLALWDYAARNRRLTDGIGEESKPFDTSRVPYLEGPSNALTSGLYQTVVVPARAYGYRGAMRDLTRETAREIYAARYWRQPGFDQIEPISPEVAAWLCETGINMGPVAAGKMLQRWLNALNNQGAVYPDLTVDGVCGPMTRHALTLFLGHRGTEGRLLLPRMLRAAQAVRYLEITEADRSQERFAWGWARRALA